MIDVRCSCGAIYHAHEDFLGRSLQCTNPACRKILRIERPAVESFKEPSSLLQEVVREQEVREKTTVRVSQYEHMRRDRRIGISIIAIGIVSLFLWLLFRKSSAEMPSPKRETAPAATTAQSETQSEPISEVARTDLKPIPPLATSRQETQRSFVPTSPPEAPVVVIPPCAVGKLPERPETGEEIEPSEGSSGDSTLEVKMELTLTLPFD